MKITVLGLSLLALLALAAPARAEPSSGAAHFLDPLKEGQFVLLQDVGPFFKLTILQEGSDEMKTQIRQILRVTGVVKEGRCAGFVVLTLGESLERRIPATALREIVILKPPIKPLENK